MKYPNKGYMLNAIDAADLHKKILFKAKKLTNG